MKKQGRLILAVIILTIFFGIVLGFTGHNPLLALIGGGIAWFMLYFLWNPPSKHKDFSDRDRLDATFRAIGGSNPPELPIPDIPEKKHHKHKKK